MKEIPLTRGYFALVDDEDYPYLSQFKWHASVEKVGYVRAVRKLPTLNGKRGKMFMHRELMGSPANLFVDHKDGDALNKCKSNLRICDQAQNSRNRSKSKNNTTGYCGVSRHGKKFQASITINSDRLYLGMYDTCVWAAIAYDQAAIECHGEFARLNFPVLVSQLNP